MTAADGDIDDEEEEEKEEEEEGKPVRPVLLSLKEHEPAGRFYILSRRVFVARIGGDGGGADWRPLFGVQSLENNDSVSYHTYTAVNMPHVLADRDVTP